MADRKIEDQFKVIDASMTRCRFVIFLSAIFLSPEFNERRAGIPVRAGMLRSRVQPF